MANMTKKIAEAKAQRARDLVYLAQTVVRMRGPHDDQAIMAAINKAVYDVSEMLTFVTDQELYETCIKLYHRYGVA